MKKFITTVSYQLKMLKHRPKLIWDYLWIRREEFHPSLETNAEALLDMNSEDRKTYQANLMKRRNDAHERGKQ